jgi:hypothetical protein
MSVVRLSSEHVDAIKDLFYFQKLMGSNVNSPEYEYFKTVGNEKNINSRIYSNFCETYLSDLKQFHAFGYVQDEIVKCIIAFYVASDEPSWYNTVCYGSGDRDFLVQSWDAVLKYNEENGIYKFFTVFNTDLERMQRRLYWSKYNNERYGYFNEYMLPKKTKTVYEKHWKILFNQILLPNDSIVRCNYLKPEYRSTVIAGNI